MSGFVGMIELVMRLLQNRGVAFLQKQLKSTPYCKPSINNAVQREWQCAPQHTHTIMQHLHWKGKWDEIMYFFQCCRSVSVLGRGQNMIWNKNEIEE